MKELRAKRNVRKNSISAYVAVSFSILAFVMWLGLLLIKNYEFYYIYGAIVLLFSVIGMITSIISMKYISREKLGGKELAQLSLILSIMFLVITIFALLSPLD